MGRVEWVLSRKANSEAARRIKYRLSRWCHMGRLPWSPHLSVALASATIRIVTFYLGLSRDEVRFRKKACSFRGCCYTKWTSLLKRCLTEKVVITEEFSLIKLVVSPFQWHCSPKVIVIIIAEKKARGSQFPCRSCINPNSFCVLYCHCATSKFQT